jgi:hypothetical protein
MSEENAPASAPAPESKPHDWRHLLYPLIAALLTAVASMLQSCTPAQLQKVDAAADRAQAQADKAEAELACARDVEKANEDLLLNPKAATPERVLKALADLKVCTQPAAEADAGAAQ